MNNLPFVSVILPLRNESVYIERGLLAISGQDYPDDCTEILIADGMSTDNTRELIRDFSDAHPHMNIQIIDNPGKIVPTGMNVALRLAKGEIIIRVDGHTLIAPNYVRKCVETLQRTHADNVGGKMNATGRNPFSRAVALATSTPFGVGGGRFHYSDEEEWVDTVYMGAWHRRVFEKIGLFDEELVRNQDDEFNYRLRGAGGKILLTPNIRSKYAVRGSPSALWKQYYQYGYWKVRVLQKHPRQMSLRQFVPPLFVLTLLASLCLVLLPSTRLLGFLIPLAYAFASIGGSALTAARHGWQCLLMLPVVFAILHLSYGTGFLIGMFKFWSRWSDKVGRVPAL